jgi:hypothetical protein
MKSLVAKQKKKKKEVEWLFWILVQPLIIITFSQQATLSMHNQHAFSCE